MDAVKTGIRSDFLVEAGWSTTHQAGQVKDDKEFKALEGQVEVIWLRDESR
jgi:hypothetical protein